VTDADARVAEIEARLAKVQALEQRARQAGWEGDLSSGTFAEEETVQLVYKFTLEDVPWLLARLREAEQALEAFRIDAIAYCSRCAFPIRSAGDKA
jgi:hypothetical protein